MLSRKSNKHRHCLVHIVHVIGIQDIQLQTCTQESYVWAQYRPQLKGRIVQPPKTGLKCTSAAALTLQQTVACMILPFNIHDIQNVWSK